MSVELTGYIIANSSWPDDVKLEMGFGSLDRSPALSWMRHIGPDGWNGPDRSIIIQRWSDKGWGPYPVTLRLENNC